MALPERDAVFDVIVIGGGTAGMTVARQVAKAGKRVILIEADRTGGECLYTGCVPSKTLLASAKRLHQIRQAAEFGIDVGHVSLDWDAVQAWREAAISAIEVHDTPDALEKAGVEVLIDAARLGGERSVEVGDRHLRADAIVIATGSTTATPDIAGLDMANAHVHTSETLMEIPALPKRLGVIGGGPVAVELGQAFSRFGSEVTVLGRNARLLPGDDHEIGAWWMISSAPRCPGSGHAGM